MQACCGSQELRGYYREKSFGYCKNQISKVGGRKKAGLGVKPMDANCKVRHKPTPSGRAMNDLRLKMGELKRFRENEEIKVKNGISHARMAIMSRYHK